MIAWNIFNGMVHSLPYKEIGQAVADGLNGAVSSFSLSEIGDTLATGLMVHSHHCTALQSVLTGQSW